jgi:hypothetical protein
MNTLDHQAQIFIEERAWENGSKMVSKRWGIHCVGYLRYYNRTHSKDILRKEIRKKIQSLCWQTVDKGIVCSKLKTQGRWKFKFQILLRNSEPLVRFCRSWWRKVYNVDTGKTGKNGSIASWSYPCLILGSNLGQDMKIYPQYHVCIWEFNHSTW